MNEIRAVGAASGLLFGGISGLLIPALTYSNSKESYGNLKTFAFLVDFDTRKILNCFIIISGLEPSEGILNQKITKNHFYYCFSDFWVWYHPEAQRFVVSKRK